MPLTQIKATHALPRMTKLGSGRGKLQGRAAVIDPSSLDEGHGIHIALLSLGSLLHRIPRC